MAASKLSWLLRDSTSFHFLGKKRHANIGQKESQQTRHASSEYMLVCVCTFACNDLDMENYAEEVIDTDRLSIAQSRRNQMASDAEQKNHAKDFPSQSSAQSQATG